MHSPTPYVLRSLDKNHAEFNLTEQEIDELNIVYEAAFVFMQVIGSILLVVGIPCNLLVISVLRSRTMHRNMTALFLTYLAAFNILNLVVGLTRYVVVSFRGPDIRLYSETLCILHTVVLNFGHLATNWTILAVGLCKMAYVLVPDTLMRNLPLSFVHSLMLTMSTYGFAVVYMFGYVIIQPDLYSKFGLVKCDQEYLTLSALIQTSCTFLVPEVCMFFVNIITIRSYYKLWSNASQHEKKMVRVSYLMGIFLFISDIELALAEIPYIVVNTFKPLIFSNTPRGAANYLLACYLSVALLYSNYALNCLTYCFFGGHFRRELRRVFRPVLSLFCQEESRWVSSEISMLTTTVEMVECQALNARLSIGNILSSDIDYSSEAPPDIYDPRTSTTLILLEEGHLAVHSLNSEISDSTGTDKLSPNIASHRLTDSNATMLTSRQNIPSPTAIDIPGASYGHGLHHKPHPVSKPPAHHHHLNNAESGFVARKISMVSKSFKSM